MVTKEQFLQNIKIEKNLELETYFNNLVNSGLVVKYGNSRTQDLRVAGGRPTLFSLKAFLDYYTRINAAECIVRDPSTSKTHTDTIQNMTDMVNEVESWGMEAYLKNISKQDYVNLCTTIDEVLAVTWESVEV